MGVPGPVGGAVVSVALSSDGLGALSAPAFVERVAEAEAEAGWTTDTHEVPFGAVVEATRDGRTRLTVVVPDASATVSADLVERLVALRREVGAAEVRLTTRGDYSERARTVADQRAVGLLDPETAVGVEQSGIGGLRERLRDRLPFLDADGGADSGHAAVTIDAGDGGGEAAVDDGDGASDHAETEGEQAQSEAGETADAAPDGEAEEQSTDTAASDAGAREAAAEADDAGAEDGASEGADTDSEDPGAEDDASVLERVVSRRTALVAGGTAAVIAGGAGVLVTQTPPGRRLLSGLLGAADLPVHPAASRVSIDDGTADRVRSADDLTFPRPDDAGVAVFSVPAGGASVGDVRDWYASNRAVNGWTLRLAAGEAFVYRRGDRGAVVVPQERNAFVDTALPVDGDPPVDVLVLSMDWAVLAPLAGGLPLYPGVTWVDLDAATRETVRTTDALAFERPADTEVSLYSIPADEVGVEAVRSWYAADERATAAGWERQRTTDRGAIYRRDDRGLVVLVQERNRLVDTGLPVDGDPPVDVLVLSMDWETLAPVV
jgi:hypothetical protein